MLETDEVNVYKCWRNSFIVDKFEREDVYPKVGKLHEYRDQIIVLKTIRDDLFKILDTQRGDIREFIAN